MKRNRQEKIDPARRRLIAQLGRFAVYTAPVMTSLLIAPESDAHHRPGHVVGPSPCDTNPNLPGCQVTCDQNPNLPGCGSLTGGGAESFSGEDFAPAEPSSTADDGGDWNEGWNE